METDIKQDLHQHQQQSVLTGVWHFVLHFVEMCLAMCIGGITLIFLFFWGATQIGFPDLIHRFPALSIMVIAIILTAVMTVWMRIRGMSWRLTIEMSSTSIILGIFLIALSWLGAIPQSDMLEWVKRLACLVMLVPMLLRLDHYTGRMDHSKHGMHPMH